MKPQTLDLGPENVTTACDRCAKDEYQALGLHASVSKPPLDDDSFSGV